MRDRKKKLVLREWLNLPGHHRNAYVVLDIENPALGYCLTVTDCERKIELYNNFGTEDDRANALHKLRTLRDICDAGIRHIEASPLTPVRPSRKKKKVVKITEAASKAEVI